ncbi:MAG TPA: SapB/AmfS family lanthipeptide [Pseudonocardiaceae bacterium]|jgi:hypothetical protein|nr:SapB/AmfS family lanthipeptide [Pseudonocardiaceae bacterium]
MEHILELQEMATPELMDGHSGGGHGGGNGGSRLSVLLCGGSTLSLITCE